MELRSGNVYLYTNPSQIAHRKYENELRRKFICWKNRISNMLHNVCNIHIDDLPDEPYYDMFCENITEVQVFYKLYREHILPYEPCNY